MSVTNDERREHAPIFLTEKESMKRGVFLALGLLLSQSKNGIAMIVGICVFFYNMTGPEILSALKDKE